MTQKQIEITKEYSKLTKHPSGTVKELFTISLPLMLSFLSNYLMLFVDRLILANYSLEAMNAATASAMFCMIFQYGAIGIASIAEVFVGQFNGSKQYKKVGSPAWQMIWFSLMCFPIFFLLAKFAGPLFLPDYHYKDFALPYFQWILYFNVAFAIQTAIASFFIGIGRVKIIMISAIISNIVNILLDIILIFGVTNLIPSYGTKGAALATGFAQIFQVSFLMVFFLSKQNRKKYNTDRLTFKPKLFLKCLRIGSPSAFGHMIEITAWAIVIHMMATLGEVYLTVMAIGQNLFAVIAFATAGLQKGITTVSANLIGAKNYIKVSKAWFSAVKLLLLFALVVSLVLLVYPDPLINAFLSKETSADVSKIYSFLRITCIFLWLYFIFDGLTWISAGILTAAGDTMFIMIMNALGAWFFALMPIYFLIVKNPSSPSYVWALMVFYAIMNSICFYLRYKFGSWRTRNKIA